MPYFQSRHTCLVINFCSADIFSDLQLPICEDTIAHIIQIRNRKKPHRGFSLSYYDIYFSMDFIVGIFVTSLR